VELLRKLHGSSSMMGGCIAHGGKVGNWGGGAVKVKVSGKRMFEKVSNVDVWLTISGEVTEGVKENVLYCVLES